MIEIINLCVEDSPKLDAKVFTLFYRQNGLKQYWKFYQSNFHNSLPPYVIAGSIAESFCNFVGDSGSYDKICQMLLISDHPQYNKGGWLGAPSENPSKRLNILPGLNSTVKHPVTGNQTFLKSCIISLNDAYGWSREQVADWLETLDVDLRFSSKKDEPEPKVTHYDHVHPVELWETDLIKKKPKSYHSPHQLKNYPGDKFYNHFNKTEAHLHFEMKNIDDKLLKLLMGEKNE